MAPKEKSVTISLRISERAAKALHEDAKMQKVSVNTLANQILLQYADYDRFIRKFHSVKLSTATLKRLIDSTEDAELEAAGRFTGKNVVKAFILAKKGEVSKENAIEALREFASYGGMYEYNDTANKEGRKILTLAHDLGPKGSIFLQRIVESLFEELADKISVERFDHAITITI